jgi:hypothetical protein
MPSMKEICETYVSFASKDHSIISFIIKCSLFGEYSYATEGILYLLAKLAVNFNCIVTSILIIVTLIDFLNIKKLKNNIWKISFNIIFLLNIISYLTMNFKLPYGCSMDFRYIVPLLFISLYCATNVIEGIKNETIKVFILDISFILIFLTFILSNIVILFSQV